jgi:[ribosomal protein S18]-alanine N-acetyltransferase
VRLQKVLEPDPHLVFSHTDSGEVVSSIEVLRGVDDAEILNIETSSSHRRRGLAQDLLVQAFDWARQNQRQAIWLEVRASNAGAIALYVKMGFEQISVRSRYYSDGEDALVMKYTL